MQKLTVELCERLESSKVAYTMEVHRVNQLTTALAKRNQLHVVELAKEKERRAEEKPSRRSPGTYRYDEDGANGATWQDCGTHRCS